MKSALKLVATTLGISMAWLGSAQAQYPTRPITMVVTFQAGGITDNIARLLAQKVSESLGKPIVIDNRPGAEGQIGAQYLSKAASDGYTIGFVSSGNMSGVPALSLNPPYDVEKDFTPIADIGRYAFFLFVNEKLPVKTFQEFVDYAKSKPGTLNYGTGNNTGVLVFAQLQRTFGLKLAHIPYKGEPAATTDLISGRIEAMVGSSAGLEHAQQGTLRTLVAFLPERSTLAPDVPVLREVSSGNLGISSWGGIIGPAGMPPEITEKLSAAFVAAANLPEVKEKIEKQGFTLVPQGPAELQKLIATQLEAHRVLVKESGIPLK
jgi:tripartite-type tricarboxylate transporter receptor subunit TctC